LPDECDDSGAHAAKEPDHDSADAAGSRRLDPSPRPLRYLFYVVWVLTVPAALAVTAVHFSKPSALGVEVGVVRNFIGEQQVPATIMFFTLFAWVLWRIRYVMPFAEAMGVLARSDVPPKLRARFDDAGLLIAEARRISAVRSEEVKRALTKRERESIEDGLEGLELTMWSERFDGERFSSDLAEADKLVAKHLGRWRKSELREYAESIGVAVAVALVLRFFVIEAFKIPSGSMIPTLMVGDHIFVAKYAYGPLLPRSDTRLYDRLPTARGDVMVFKFPENKEQDFIKRVIALPGDTLETVDGRPVLNGWLVPHCYVGQLILPHGVNGHAYVEYLGDKAFLTMYDGANKPLPCTTNSDCDVVEQCRGGICGVTKGPYKIAAGEAWVMGDNRDNSHDSLRWKSGLGAGVPFENIKGRAMFVWWSWDPRGGIAQDRVFVNVMGVPRLPPGASPELVASLQRCLGERPPLSKTSPP
jgi:signal peptidase I